MIYTIEEIREKVKPVAEKYNIPEVFLFGSYARKEATEKSDLDFLVDENGSRIHSMLDVSALYAAFEEAFGKGVDIVLSNTLKQQKAKVLSYIFINSIENEKVKVYG